MYQAYQNGLLGGFLSSNIIVHSLIKSRNLSPLPIKGQTIGSKHFYHYFGIGFTPLILQFSELVKKKQPFPF